MRAFSVEFLHERESFRRCRQIMFCSDALFTPVLTPNVSSFSGASTPFLVWGRVCFHPKLNNPLFFFFGTRAKHSFSSRGQVIWVTDTATTS